MNTESEKKKKNSSEIIPDGFAEIVRNRDGEGAPTIMQDGFAEMVRAGTCDSAEIHRRCASREDCTGDEIHRRRDLR